MQEMIVVVFERISTAMENYKYLKSRNQSEAFSRSGLDVVLKSFVKLVTYLLTIVVGIWWLSDQANALEVKVLSSQEKYVKELEGVLATCLGEREGVITIGDDVYFCKAVAIGVKK